MQTPHTIPLVKTCSAVLALVLTAAGPARAADHADWSIKGNIQPATCGLLLSGGGEANFGVISSADIRTWDKVDSPARYTRPSFTRSINVAVNCAMPSKFGLYVTDNREATVVPAAAPTRFGLGTYTPPGGSATNIGSYQVNHSRLMLQLTATTEPVLIDGFLVTPGVATSGTSWTTASPYPSRFLQHGYTHGYSQFPMSSPDSAVSLRGPLIFTIEPLAEVVDRATSDIVMDGRATLTLVAL